MAMIAQNLAPIVPIPAILYTHPIGIYGISYDISTKATEDDLPDGWNSPRGSTYCQLIRILTRADYVRDQYSDYRSLRTGAWTTWALMWTLRNIKPAMKFESTVLGLKMQFYIEHALYDITDGIQLGGYGAQRLRGITPAGLVLTAQAQGAVLNPAPIAVNLNMFQRPQGTKRSVNAVNPANWLA